jgi:hypothetical protein
VEDPMTALVPRPAENRHMSMSDVIEILMGIKQ